MEPKTFTGLPTELLCSVAEMIGSQGSLCSLARSCRAMYGVMTPMLYRNVEFWDESQRARGPRPHPAARREVDNGGSGCRQYKTMYRFACSVLENANLAAHVRTFTYHGLICTGTREGRRRGFDISEALCQAVERLKNKTEYRKRWLLTLRRWCNEDALLALVLPALPRMERLDCDIPNDADYTLVVLLNFAFHKTKRYPASAFEKLHTVTNQGYMDYTFKALCLSLPALKCLSGRIDGNREIDPTMDMSEETEHETIELPEDKPYSAVAEINLHLVQPCLNVVKLMAETCVALRTLKLTFTYNQYTFHALTQLQKGIMPAQHTLETLELTYNANVPLFGEYEWEDEWELKLDLTKFTKLHFLKLGMAFVSSRPAIISPDMELERDHKTLVEDSATHMLDLVQLLPPNIMNVHLQRDENEVLTGQGLFWSLEQLLTQKTSDFPNLGCARVEIADFVDPELFEASFVRFMQASESDAAVARLEEMAREVGMDLAIRRS